MLKRTPLFSQHQRLGARLVEFGGWEMPVQYTSIVDEHQAVRTTCGLFDIAHMGEVLVSGPGALAWLNTVLTNDLSRLTPGCGQYTLLCNENGGVIDDLYAYQLEPDTFLLIINASRIDADLQWLRQQRLHSPRPEDILLEDASERMGALALQGPRAADFIDRAFSKPSVGGQSVPAPTSLRKNQVAAFEFGRDRVWVARTGYTGEDGFEIVAPASLLEAAWTLLFEDGQRYGALRPCGLGARDTLRTEMGYPLYGHELDENTTPLEAGLGAFVALGKGEFIGRRALEAQKTGGVRRKCVAFRMTDRSAPPRSGYPILSTGSPPERIGQVASGTQSPSLGIGIGMGYVPVEVARPGTSILIEIRGRPSPAVMVTKPIYKKAV